MIRIIMIAPYEGNKAIMEKVVSGYDIIRAVHAAIHQYHPEKIAFISLNRVAQRYLSLGINRIGKPAQKQLPFIWPMIEKSLRVGDKMENEVCGHGDQLPTLDYIPIRQGGMVNGPVIFIHSVDRIQKEEELIRKKIQGKGGKSLGKDHCKSLSECDGPYGAFHNPDRDFWRGRAVLPNSGGLDR